MQVQIKIERNNNLNGDNGGESEPPRNSEDCKLAYEKNAASASEGASRYAVRADMSARGASPISNKNKSTT